MSHAPHGMEPAANPEVDGTDGSWDLTAPLREAIAEGEKLIAAAPFIRTEADLLATGWRDWARSVLGELDRISVFEAPVCDSV